MQSAEDTLAAGPDAALGEQSYTYDINWQSPAGRTYSGRFTHRCPTVGETIAIEAAVARRTEGAELSGGMRDHALMIEHLEVTLKQRPDWAKPVADIPHLALLSAVAKEAAAHLRCFFGPQDSDNTGDEVA